MKVLKANNYHFLLGGSERVYLETGELLQSHGHDVIYFSGDDRRNLDAAYAELFPNVIDPSLLRPRDFPRYVYNQDVKKKLQTLLDQSGLPDIAHLHIFYGRLTCSILAPLRDRGIPIIQSLHEYKVACPVYTMERNGKVCSDCLSHGRHSVVRNRCKKNSLIASSLVFIEDTISRALGSVSTIEHFICVSYFQKKVMELAGVPAHKMSVLHNFASPALLNNRISSKKRSNHFLYFGRLEINKGISTLLSIAVKNKVPLAIAGDGSLRKLVESVASNNNNIEYLGVLSGQALTTAIAEARATVIPSEWYENCPMSVIESKALGTPVIGANIGGIPELIRDGEDGLLFDAGNEDALAGAFERLNGMDTMRMGRRAQNDVTKRFSPVKYYDDLMRIYSSVVA